MCSDSPKAMRPVFKCETEKMYGWRGSGKGSESSFCVPKTTTPNWWGSTLNPRRGNGNHKEAIKAKR